MRGLLPQYGSAPGGSSLLSLPPAHPGTPGTGVAASAASARAGFLGRHSAIVVHLLEQIQCTQRVLEQAPVVRRAQQIDEALAGLDRPP